MPEAGALTLRGLGASTCMAPRTMREKGSGVRPAAALAPAREMEPHKSPPRFVVATPRTPGRLLERLEAVDKMARRAPGGEYHHVETEAVAAVEGVLPGPVLGSAGEARRLACGNDGARVGGRGPVLDLDEGQAPAAHGNEVDFAGGCGRGGR